MDPGLAGLAGPDNFPGTAFADHLSLVADLPAHLGVEDRVIEDHPLFSADIEDGFNVGAGVIMFVTETSIRLFFCAFRARLRCSSIKRSNPSVSTVSPRSRAINCVRSSGKP